MEITTDSIRHLHGNPQVPAIDFREWLGKLELRPGDQVLCKVDIEGSEVELFKHLRKAKPTKYGPPMCLIDRLWVEFHSRMFEEGRAASKMKSFETSFEEDIERLCRKSKYKPKFRAWY